MLTVMLMMMTTMITPLLLSLLFVIMTLYCPAPHSHYSHHYQPILLFHTFPSYHCRCPVGPTALPTRPSRRGQLWSRTTSFSPIFVRSLSSMVPASQGVLERFSALIIGHSMAFQFSLSLWFSVAKLWYLGTPFPLTFPLADHIRFPYHAIATSTSNLHCRPLLPSVSHSYK